LKLKIQDPEATLILGPAQDVPSDKPVFVFLLEPCQKNLDMKGSRFLRTPSGISKKDIMNMGRLLNTELSRTNLPP
jgi:hypothetical protein